MLKHQLLSTHPKTYSKSIYSAPELFLKKNQNFFSEELIKADIYSMGMIMLQISNKQEIRGLNMIENDTQLKKCIAGVEESWIRDVLMHMLCRDPDARLDGIALTKFLPKKFTLPN
jgi:serine/threonine protein kinase